MESPRSRAPQAIANTAPNKISNAVPSELVQKNQSNLTFVPKFLVTGENRKLFIDWLSGLVSGFVSVSACAPLDLARTRHMILVKKFFNEAKSDRQQRIAMDKYSTRVFSKQYQP